MLQKDAAAFFTIEVEIIGPLKCHSNAPQSFDAFGDGDGHLQCLPCELRMSGCAKGKGQCAGTMIPAVISTASALILRFGGDEGVHFTVPF